MEYVKSFFEKLKIEYIGLFDFVYFFIYLYKIGLLISLEIFFLILKICINFKIGV